MKNRVSYIIIILITCLVYCGGSCGAEETEVVVKDGEPYTTVEGEMVKIDMSPIKGGSEEYALKLKDGEPVILRGEKMNELQSQVGAHFVISGVLKPRAIYRGYPTRVIEIREFSTNPGDRRLELMKIDLASSAFKNGEMIPGKYTCDGEELSPPLSWSGIPQGAKSIALISDDPDAPKGDWVHWLIFNLPSDTKGLPEGVSHDERLASGAVQGIHDGKGVGYGGPYPPSGTHRYYFKVYALDTELALGPDVTKKSLLKAMEGHILAQGELMGRYKRR